MTEDSITIMDVATAVIAFIALFVAIWTTLSSRKHNRLSVRPHISVVRVVDNNDGIKKGLHLRNHGLGPAFIKKLSFTIPKKRLKMESYEEIKQILSTYEFEGPDLGIYWLEILPKDACERVIWLENEEFEKNEEFKKLMFDMQLVVNYQSFYGENHVAKSEILKNTEQGASHNERKHSS